MANTTPISATRKSELEAYGREVAESVFTPRGVGYSWVAYGKPLEGVEKWSSEHDIIVQAFNLKIEELRQTLPQCEGVMTVPDHRLLIEGQWCPATVDHERGSRYRLPEGSLTSNPYILR